ncbi:MAG: hypothetical protein HYT48_01185 [Candidatus Vogelbacteria bacterium]|nr:hypothetical protein [Candidatus Vogelbacteria bacterium]
MIWIGIGIFWALCTIVFLVLAGLALHKFRREQCRREREAEAERQTDERFAVRQVQLEKELEVLPTTGGDRVVNQLEKLKLVNIARSVAGIQQVEINYRLLGQKHKGEWLIARDRAFAILGILIHGFHQHGQVFTYNTAAWAVRVHNDLEIEEGMAAMSKHLPKTARLFEAEVRHARELAGYQRRHEPIQRRNGQRVPVRV